MKFMVWKKVAEKDSIPSGKGWEFKVDGKKIAIFNKNGYHALDALCVHQDGSIAAGELDGDVVECPLHFWHYNIKTGKLLDYLEDVKLQTYSVEVHNDGIYVDI
jgi:nitrite reductase/ring-hydroxylating ferredoxin subunit